MDPSGPIARRFPLVARPRPACTPLTRRVADLADRAQAAEHDRDLAGAAAVHNLTALLFSDLGLPELARAWCHRQANTYLCAHPLGARAARHALEPLVNLVRLHIRAEEGEQAAHLIDTLYAAVSTRTAAVIDGIQIPADLTHSSAVHQDVRRWLWAVLLATSARALAVAGRWEEAHTKLRAHKGIGRRMLDGRQAAVIARIVATDTSGARALLDDTTAGEPWENAVTACLTLLCDGTGDADTLVERYRRLDFTAPDLAVFHTRLGLSTIDALGGTEHPLAEGLAAELIDRTLTTPDGYAARDLLTHPGCLSLLDSAQKQTLSRRVAECALDGQKLPAPLRAIIDAALTRAEKVITHMVVHDRSERSA